MAGAYTSQAHSGTQEPPVKTRAACDECRTKKLKCTGERPACSRCAKEGIQCVYSPQKQMGRPKKRMRADDGSATIHPHCEDHGLGTAGSGGNYAAQQPYDARKSSSVVLSGLAPSISDYSDVGLYDETFGSGGNLQPWLQPQMHGDEWDFAMQDAGTVPSLTPDGSSHSPPIPATTAADMSSRNGSIPSFGDMSTNLLLDPALAAGSNLGIPSGTLPNCACLSSMYLTLNTLSSMDPAHTFPFALHPLREAMQTASEVISCNECPQRFLTALQNTQLLGTLLFSIAERFGKILQRINEEAARAEAAGENKKFRLADLNSGNGHLHTGGIGCAAAFSIDLSPREWRTMAKKVVKSEVLGPYASSSDADADSNPGSGEHLSCAYFVGVLKQYRERQEGWHTKPAEHLPNDFPKEPNGDPIGGPRGNPTHGGDGEQHICLKMLSMAYKAVDGYDWS